MSSSVKSSSILKVSKGSRTTLPDLLAKEEPLEIRLTFGKSNDRREKKLAVTMRTPGNDLELALGFLYAEGIINSYSEVTNIRHCESVQKEEEKGNVVKVELSPEAIFDISALERNFYTSSSCGVCGKSSIESVEVSCLFTIKQDSSIVKEEVIYHLSDTLRKSQDVFEYTGGIHASGLFDLSGNLLLSREDVGRHNALDKIIGASLFKNDIPLFGKILLVSGRASFELIQKAARAGIPIVAAVGAPSSLAVELAQENGITLVGFLKNEVFNIYSEPHRIQ